MDKYLFEFPTNNFSGIGYSGRNISTALDQQSELERLNDKHLMKLLPSIIYTSFLMLIGTPGNGIVLYVYFFKWRKSTSRMFILFLAGLDFLNCITTLPIEIFIMRYSLIIDMPWLCKISRFGTFTMNSASAAILVAIAIDRFKRICRPYGNQFTSSHSKNICIGCILFALLLTWPALILYGTRTIKLGNIFGTSCLLRNTFDTSVYPYVYFIVMMGSTVIIFSILSILYYFVGIQIYRHGMFKQGKRRIRYIPKRKVCSNSHSGSVRKATDSDDTSLAKPLNNELVKINHTEVKGQRINMTNKINDCLNMKELKPANGTEYLLPCNNHLEPAVSYQTELNKPLNSDEQIKCAQTNEGLLKQISPQHSTSTEQNCSRCMRLNIRIGKSTLMLFLITLAYIMSFLPYYALAIIRQQKGFESQLSDSGYMVFHVFLRSYQLSSAINPIIYSFCNNQFRTFVLELFRRHKYNP